MNTRTRRTLAYLTCLGVVVGAVSLTLSRSDSPTVASTQADSGPPLATPNPQLDTVQVDVPAEDATPILKNTPPPRIRTYIVEVGDTLEAIAEQNGLRTATLLDSNPGVVESELQVGQELLIPAVDGLVHTAMEGDTLWDIAVSHSVQVDDVIKANPDIAPDALQPGQFLLIPGGLPARRSNQVVSRSGPSRPESAPIPATYTCPLRGEISDYYGWRTHPVYGTRNYHQGIDIAVPEGTAIAAIAPGTVVMAEWYGGYGLTVKIDHGNGLVSRYSHGSDLLVSVNEVVTQGQTIALSGNTGVSTGPHLDFGVYREGTSFNPLEILP